MTGATLAFSDVATGRKLHTVKLTDPDRPDHQLYGLDIQLAKDRKTLVSFGSTSPEGHWSPDNLLSGWDVATRKQLFQRTRALEATRFAVSPDLNMLAVTQAGRWKRPATAQAGRWKGPPERPLPGWTSVRLEDLVTGEHLLSLPQVEGETWPVAFSPDGRLLATYTYQNRQGNRALRSDEITRTLRLWELESASEVIALPIRDYSRVVFRVAFSPAGRLLAVPDPRGQVLLWDLGRGKEVKRLQGEGGDVTSLAFSPDGRRLVSGLFDSSVLVWDVSGLTSREPARLDAAAAARAWTDLAGEPRKAFATRAALADAPAQAVALLKGGLKPVPLADPARLRRLIAELDGDTFAGREEARRRLAEVGEGARAALEEALKQKPSLEAYRRIQELLTRLGRPVTDPEVLRGLRAVAVLEDIGTAEARKVLQTLAAGAPQARLTQEARVALQRLAKRPPSGR